MRAIITVGGDASPGEHHVSGHFKIGRARDGNARRRAEEAHIGARRGEGAVLGGEDNVAGGSQLTAGGRSQTCRRVCN